MREEANNMHARQLNINVGDQKRKNTVTIQLRTDSYKYTTKSYWRNLKSGCQNDDQFQFHSHIINNLIPITRWYKQSIRKGNGVALEVWMLLAALFTVVGKTNYRDESSTQVVDSIAKWPLAYGKLQRSHTINLDTKKGRHLAGDEWVEKFLVRPISMHQHQHHHHLQW